MNFKRAAKASLACVVIPLLARAAWSALPPISDAERQRQAVAIVEARVLTIEQHAVTAQVGTNLQSTARVRLGKVRKGKLRAGQIISVRWWNIKTRPDGWVGPSGQYNAPKTGERRLLFLARDAVPNRFKLLEPNGSELLPAAKVKPMIRRRIAVMR